MSAAPRPGQRWRCRDTRWSGREFVILEVREDHVKVLGLTKADGTPIESYLQRTNKVSLERLASYWYELLEDALPSREPIQGLTRRHGMI